jgi:hypothetical protein
VLSERSEIISKAHKIKALADRGIDGEKQAAINMLDIYIKKHNVTEDELATIPKGTTYADSDFDDLLNKLRKETEFADVIVGGVLVMFSDMFGGRGKRSRETSKEMRKKGLELLLNALKKKNDKRKD